MQMPKITDWKGVATEEIKAFFLEASAKTYAAGVSKRTVASFPGSKVLSYESLGHADRLWQYVDCYYSSGRRSFGQTTISVSGITLWGMQYRGFWQSEDEERVIPFLKRALMAAYGAKAFVGGRGPRVYRETEGGLLYCNYPESDDFTNFKGHEEIVDDTNAATLSGFLFRHKYEGLLL